jgi:hypothetical protein
MNEPWRAHSTCRPAKNQRARPLPVRPFDPFDEARLAGRHDWLLPLDASEGLTSTRVTAGEKAIAGL